jgi:hypothetical protein
MSGVSFLNPLLLKMPLASGCVCVGEVPKELP